MPDSLNTVSLRTTADRARKIAAEAALDIARRSENSAAWPSMRGDMRNSGRMRVAPIFRDDLAIRHYRTGNAVFSTPVIGSDETIYVGSADHRMYAIDPVADAVLWSYDVGEVIDTAACIGEDGSVYVPTGGGLYAFSPKGDVRWHIDLLKQKEHFSPSTIYWWEGNAVVGPNGWVYAGCDDFHVYAVDPQGNVRWRVLTGCCVWTAGVFGSDDTVYFISFDFHLYAFDMHTGRIKWTRNMKNFIVSSPMIGPDNTLYVGSFDRKLYAIDASNGETRWTFETGAPVYASPTIDDQGHLYVGSSDGNVYCIDTETRKILWTRYLGDCVRSSVALGPDPEARYPYLAYVGSGTGTVYAFEPDGTCRWSYDTLAGGPERAQYCNINAAVALGRHGISTASANGDIVYIPYTACTACVDTPGFRVRPSDPFPTDGTFLYPVSMGGVVDPSPIDGHDLVAAPGDTVSLRLVHREAGETVPAVIDASSLRCALPDDFPVRVRVSTDGWQVNVIPDGDVRPGTYPITIGASYVAGGEAKQFSTSCRIAVQPVDRPSSGIVGRTFRIEQMSIYMPSIVASFDQIGIASLAIDVRIVRHDPTAGTVLAWGVQKFGVGPDGEPIAGIPVPRTYFFAFGGRYSNGTLSIESVDCQFEITAFPVPLDRLRFTASVTDDRIIASSMIAEVRLGRAIWRTVLSWLPLPRLGGGGRFAYRLAKTWGMFAAWFPERRPWKGLSQLWVAARRMLPHGFWILAARVWHPWSMLDANGDFLGLGTFIASDARAVSHDALRVRHFAFHRRRRQVIAQFEASNAYVRGDASPGIVLMNRATGKPLEFNYCLALRTDRDKRHRPTKVILDVPATIDLTKGVDAILFVDTEERATLNLA